MATDTQPDALSHLRGVLAAHARDPRARMVQLDKTLNALQAAFDQVDQEQRLLARSVLQIDAVLFRAGPAWEGLPPTDYVKLRAIASRPT